MKCGRKPKKHEFNDGLYTVAEISKQTGETYARVAHLAQNNTLAKLNQPEKGTPALTFSELEQKRSAWIRNKLC